MGEVKLIMLQNEYGINRKPITIVKPFRSSPRGASLDALDMGT